MPQFYPRVLMRCAQDRVFCLGHGSPGLAHGSSDRAVREGIPSGGGLAHGSSGLLLRLLLIASLLATLSGCYVMQAATGQMHVLEARKPIDKVIADPGTPESLKETLTEVRAAREF